MIVVTGTERSGTSLMMNILKEAGYPIHGEAYPNGWDGKLKKHNPNGFWESELRHLGINHDTLRKSPELFTNKVIKVLHTGLNNSNLKYIDKMIIMIRNPEEVVQSYHKLISDDNKIEHLLKIPGTIEDHYVQQYYFTFLYLNAKFNRVPYIVINYNKLLRKPGVEIKRLKEFLTVGRFDLSEKLVDPSLYRNKQVDKSYIENPVLLEYCKKLKQQIVDGQIYSGNNFYFLQKVIDKINENNLRERFGQ